MVNYLTLVHSRLNGCFVTYFFMDLCTYAGFEIKYVLVLMDEKAQRSDIL